VLPVPTEVPEWARGIVNLLETPASKKRAGGVLGIGKGLSEWLHFNVKGKELGFKLPELQLLFQTAERIGLDDPKTLLWSDRALDRCLQAIFWQHYRNGNLANKDVENLLYRLMQYRQGLEMGRPRFKRGIMSTRSITMGQNLKIVVSGVGIFASKVTGLNRDHIDIELPKGRQLPGGFSWKNREVEVYFWKKEDAGYSFDSQILNAPDKSMHPTLQMSHSDSLIRTQKRASMRLKVKLDARIVPLRGSSEANEKFEEGIGYRARLVDISDAGAAVLVRGVLEPGLYLKIFTRLADLPIVLSGEIKSVNINKAKQFSVLHVEAIPLSRAMKIRVLAFVLGVTRLDSTQALAKQLKQEQNLGLSPPSKPLLAVEEELPQPRAEDLAQAGAIVSELENLEEETLPPA
jgi:c-di-GMP-binding flagellar brake protein YcgR